MVGTGGEAVAHDQRLRLDKVEVVEQPLGGRGNGKPAVDVLGEGTVRRGEGVEAVLQPGQHTTPGAPRSREQGGPGGESPRGLLESQ